MLWAIQNQLRFFLRALWVNNSLSMMCVCYNLYPRYQCSQRNIGNQLQILLLLLYQLTRDEYQDTNCILHNNIHLLVGYKYCSCSRKIQFLVAFDTNYKFMYLKTAEILLIW
jgi:hypothetical protein